MVVVDSRNSPCHPPDIQEIKRKSLRDRVKWREVGEEAGRNRQERRLAGVRKNMGAGELGLQGGEKDGDKNRRHDD